MSPFLKIWKKTDDRIGSLKLKLHEVTFVYFLCDNYNSTKLCSSIVTARISNEKFPFLRPFYGISSELKNDYDEEEEEEKNNADPFFASK